MWTQCLSKITSNTIEGSQMVGTSASHPIGFEKEDAKSMKLRFSHCVQIHIIPS